MVYLPREALLVSISIAARQINANRWASMEIQQSLKCYVGKRNASIESDLLIAVENMHKEMK